MRKRILTALLIGLSFQSFSQTSLFQDSMKVDNSTILIATSSSQKNYEFCITKAKDIKKELSKLTYGEIQEAPFEKNPVVIKLVNKGLIVQTWIVKPKASVIEIGNRKYKFDAAELERLAEKYPINYSVEEKNFEDETLLTASYENLLKDKDFLYMVQPDFHNQWQGKFILTFKKSDTFSSPLTISNYLRPKFEAIESKNKYSIVYEPFDIGKNDGKTRFSMTVFGTKKLYKNFSDASAMKGEWQAQPYTAYIIRKK